MPAAQNPSSSRVFAHLDDPSLARLVLIGEAFSGTEKALAERLLAATEALSDLADLEKAFIESL